MCAEARTARDAKGFGVQRRAGIRPRPALQTTACDGVAPGARDQLDASAGSSLNGSAGLAVEAATGDALGRRSGGKADVSSARAEGHAGTDWCEPSELRNRNNQPSLMTAPPRRRPFVDEMQSLPKRLLPAYGFFFGKLSE